MRLVLASSLLLSVFMLGMFAGRNWTMPIRASSSPPALTVRLHRFRLKPDQLAEFDRWIAIEHAHHEETLGTLEREHMYVESIFRDRDHNPSTIYWAEVRGEGGASVATSPLPIDKVYEEFMHRTLVPGSHRTFLPEYSLIPIFLTDAMRTHQEAQESKHGEAKP